MGISQSDSGCNINRRIRQKMWIKVVLEDKKDNIRDTVIFLVGKYYLLCGGEGVQKLQIL